MIMRKPLLRTGLLLAVLCFVCQGCTGIGNPHQEPEKIRQNVLKLTPRGLSMPEVEARLRKREIQYDKSLKHGFVRQSDGQVIGVKSIQARLGDYWSGSGSAMIVTGFWGFDSDDKLVDVWVWKVAESL